ncbi:MAG: carbonic anhydrase family protein [Dehalococcoidia bacterium]
MPRTDSRAARLPGRVWLSTTFLGAVALVAACSGDSAPDQDIEALTADVSQIQADQRAVTRELETLQREVESLASEVSAFALEAGHDAEAGDHPTGASTESAHEAPHWTYAGETGPEMWGSLADDWAMCSTGTSQSPINISASLPIGLTDVQFDYVPSALTVINNGHTIQGNVAEGSGVMVDGERYELLQFHFHAPSEHEIDGKPAAMEVHFVHRNAEGELAVIGALYQLGEHNPTLDGVWAALPTTTEDEVHIDGFVAEALLPLDRSVFRYSGSLTTPPCSEGVKWHVITTPLSASAEQVEAFINIVGDNARPVQPLNGRSVLADVAKG